MMRYAYMDLFLDTTPYGAHTTAADALWAGVPIVTLQGQSFASRVGASLLTAVGLDELICKTAIEYVELAVSLADCPERLGQYKATLNDARDQSTLFDSPQFADNLESLYRTMAERNFLGLKPDHIFATPSSPRHHQRFGISPNVPAECQKFGLP